MSLPTFQELKKNLKQDFSTLPVTNIALLADSATQLLAQSIKGYGYTVNINFNLFEADYDQIERQILDPTSELYAFKPEYVVIFYCSNKLLKKFGKLALEDKPKFAETHIEKSKHLYTTLTANLKCKVIYFNFNEIDDNVFGHYGNKTTYSFNYQLRKINFELMNLCQQQKNLFLLDLNLLQAQWGQKAVSDNKIYVTTDLLFSIDFLPRIAKALTDIITAIQGKIKKCLILDLDNTLWGGIIGDDGVEGIQIGELGIGKAFTELQLWIKQLKQRGIILAICSKNDEAVAKEPFEKHPEMVLRLEDISVFVANWNNKADNVQYIQKVLNIGFDSMVFLDDNPFERNMVRTHVKDITIPELPEDPAEYMNFLRTQNLFETTSFTQEDEQRTLQYQEEAKRAIAQEQFTNENDFLASLSMVAPIAPFNTFNTPRVAQLTQRSNQFNLRTIRYTEEDVQRMANDPNYITLTYSLSDKYGDYGLISVVIMKKIAEHTLFVDTWIMSCRVLKRNMEIFVLNTMVEAAKANGYKTIVGEFIASPKNNMVKNHYSNLGFTPTKENEYTLSLDGFIPGDCFIQPEKN
ncbi:MAG: HAD-IIIC family phosphatase [Ferruginibacter sp.]